MAITVNIKDKEAGFQTQTGMVGSYKLDIFPLSMFMESQCRVCKELTEAV